MKLFFKSDWLTIGKALGFFIEITIFKYKNILFEIVRGDTFFSLKLNHEKEGDHRALFIFDLKLIYLFNLELSIRDTRHWNYDKKRPYTEGEELEEYIFEHHAICLRNLEKFLKEQGWVITDNNVKFTEYKWSEYIKVRLPFNSNSSQYFVNNFSSIVRTISQTHGFDHQSLLNKIVFNLR